MMSKELSVSSVFVGMSREIEPFSERPDITVLLILLLLEYVEDWKL